MVKSTVREDNDAVANMGNKLENEKPLNDVLVDQLPEKSFTPKIEKYLSLISEYCPFLENYELSISTANTFPHSSGIASSASGFSALSMFSPSFIGIISINVNLLSLELVCKYNLNYDIATIYFKIFLAITSFWISVVPSPMVQSFESL